MTRPIQSILDAGSTLWLDSVDPDEVKKNKARGITGATSNPAIIAALIATGRFDDTIKKFMGEGHDDEAIAWAITDKLTKDAAREFKDDWEKSRGNTGWVSFELDPLLEDPDNGLSVAERSRKYVELGKRWAEGQVNRMIKVPATEAGLGALEELAAAGVTLNVTLIFSERQYLAARDAVWRGRQRHGSKSRFKSVYSIFISRVDVYTKEHCPELSEEAQGKVGLVNAKQIGLKNAAFWEDKELALKQEMIWASTGKKLDWQEEDYYVGNLVGADIQTNPPETFDALESLGKSYEANATQLPPQHVVDEINQKVDIQKLEDTLMREGTAKFADPHKKLLASIQEKRAALG
ncbi:transaldolase family protein [Phycisphaera mikurensis]|uniref:Transaldolase n=1 Tax=Phycisphaera mikurensis (strain NBRC 102666 / KCTC 22515 / FYK2301M01) TaxID=1142394 RepID=I0IG17_PHYMF|nr:transaldolase family protein [Phycisphaera mikurensis]MBB6440410.1 transaldolase [Phycisphaera mikurensis]BAM04205.1 putative transaldolase [Phycisphaera mikurensis NBRC 102666]